MPAPTTTTTLREKLLGENHTGLGVEDIKAAPTAELDDLLREKDRLPMSLVTALRRELYDRGYRSELRLGNGTSVHLVKSGETKSLCGRFSSVGEPGRLVHYRGEVTCARCHKLAFVGVNASSPGVPNYPSTPANLEVAETAELVELIDAGAPSAPAVESELVRRAELELADAAQATPNLAPPRERKIAAGEALATVTDTVSFSSGSLELLVSFTSRVFDLDFTTTLDAWKHSSPGGYLLERRQKNTPELALAETPAELEELARDARELANRIVAAGERYEAAGDTNRYLELRAIGGGTADTVARSLAKIAEAEARELATRIARGEYDG